MQKTRVLFVLPQLDAGGSERVVFDLARNLDPDEFEVFVASFHGGVLVEPLKTICNEVFIIEKKQGFDLYAMMKVAKIIKTNRIDTVNSHHYMPCFYSFLGAKVLNDKKLIYTEHSVPEVEMLTQCIHGKIFHWMLHKINAVVGVSTAITEKFREKYPRHADKIHEILNGVDIEKFREKNARNTIRSKWGLTQNHFVVGTVANFRKVKNHICLVRAAGILKDTHPQLRLLFVGTGFPGDAENSETEVLELIRDLGLQDRVVLTGYQENIPQMLSAFDVFCLPSFSEGLPVSLLEAMAAGVPVIGSEVAGISEVISHGKTGLLFPSDEDKRLAILLEEIMSDPKNSTSLATGGYAYVNKNHSSKAWIKRCALLFVGSKCY